MLSIEKFSELYQCTYHRSSSHKLSITIKIHALYNTDTFKFECSNAQLGFWLCYHVRYLKMTFSLYENCLAAPHRYIFYLNLKREYINHKDKSYNAAF